LVGNNEWEGGESNGRWTLHGGSSSRKERKAVERLVPVRAAAAAMGFSQPEPEPEPEAATAAGASPSHRKFGAPALKL